MTIPALFALKACGDKNDDTAGGSGFINEADADVDADANVMTDSSGCEVTGLQ